MSSNLKSRIDKAELSAAANARSEVPYSHFYGYGDEIPDDIRRIDDATTSALTGGRVQAGLGHFYKATAPTEARARPAAPRNRQSVTRRRNAGTFAGTMSEWSAVS